MPLNQDENNKEKLANTAFISEKIKQRPVNRKKLLMRTVTTVSLAVIFGIVACFTFLLLQPVFSDRLYPEKEPETVSFPEESASDELTPEMIEDLKAIGQEVLLAKDYAMETIDQFMLELPQIMAEMDGGLPIGDLIGMGILLADAIIIVALMAEYLAENNISFSKAKGKGKDKGKEKDKNKTKKPEKPHRKNKDGEPLGKNGPEIRSKKTFQRGKTERVEVENQNPGDGNGNVHYHDPQNTKYIFDPVTGKFYFDRSPFLEAPPIIQKVLEDPEIQKAIDKALRYLGEPPFFK